MSTNLSALEDMNNLKDYAKSPIKIVFMGTPQFSAEILEELNARFDVVCVYTQPDKVRGRGKKLMPTPVKEMAQSLSLEVRTPNTLKDENEVEYLRTLSPDFICVSAYGAILPQSVLDIPKYMALNVHTSLLPRWRGAAPVERAILAGDEQVGVCIMKMEAGLDTGDYCIVRKMEVGERTLDEVMPELSMLGASALISAIELITQDFAYWTPQDESLVTYAHKIERGELNLKKDISAIQNLRFVKASNDAHPSRVNISGRDVSIIDASCVNLDGDYKAGDVVVSGKRLFLIFEDGALAILRLKPAGKKAMPIDAYLAGARLDSDAYWEEVK